jgi:hypothetical protein
MDKTGLLDTLVSFLSGCIALLAPYLLTHAIPLIGSLVSLPFSSPSSAIHYKITQTIEARLIPSSASPLSSLITPKLQPCTVTKIQPS